MAKITLSDQAEMCKCLIDTGVMDVEVTESYLGVSFVTVEGEELTVWMRDGGFEVNYHSGIAGKFVEGIEMKGGTVSVP